MKHYHFDTLTSTNDYLKEHINELCDLCYVTATNQTMGKGRKKRIWYNEPNQGLALSILIKKPKLEMNQYSVLIALSFIDMLKKYNINAMIKWPNDIVIGNKKICGILLEGQYDNEQNYLIIGAGLNVNNKEFVDKISSRATSMYLQTNMTYSLKKVEKDLIKCFKTNLKKSLRNYDKLMQTYKEYSCVLNQTILFDYEEGISKIGYVKDINPDGSLVVFNENDGVDYLVNSGEVTIKNFYDWLFKIVKTSLNFLDTIAAITHLIKSKIINGAITKPKTLKKL